MFWRRYAWNQLVVCRSYTSRLENLLSRLRVRLTSGTLLFAIEICYESLVLLNWLSVSFKFFSSYREIAIVNIRHRGMNYNESLRSMIFLSTKVSVEILLGANFLVSFCDKDYQWSTFPFFWPDVLTRLLVKCIVCRKTCRFDIIRILQFWFLSCINLCTNNCRLTLFLLTSNTIRHIASGKFSRDICK